MSKIEALTSIAQTMLRSELRHTGDQFPKPGAIARWVTASAKLVDASDADQVVAITELSRRYGVGTAACAGYQWQ